MPECLMPHFCASPVSIGIHSLQRHGVSVNGIEPRIVPRRLSHTPHGPPNHAVALEPRPESNLPNPVSSLHPFLSFQVGQLIPDTAARSVAKPVQCHSWCLYVLLTQFKIPLQLIEHRLAGCMDTEVLKGKLVVWNVRLGRWRWWGPVAVSR